MEPRPTHFGRNRGGYGPTIGARPLTQAQALEIRNGLWDAQQEIARLRDEMEAVINVVSDHDRAITHHDNDILQLRDRPEAPAMPSDSGVDPAMFARGEAWEQIIAGLTIYVGQGVVGNELAEMIGVAVLEVERRTGMDAGTQS